MNIKTPEEFAQVKREMIDWIAATDPDTAAHLEGLSDEGFNTLILIAAHRLDPQRCPHPGYGAA